MNYKVIKEDKSGNISRLDFNGAQISRDGLRAVDSGIITCPSRVSVNQGDVIKFISDVADTSHLRGAYLFHGSCLDESGYNVDPVNQTHPTISGWTDYDGINYETNSTSSSKFYNFHQAYIPSSSQGVFLENKTMPNGDPVHDFSGNFDIFAWVTTPSTTGGTHTIYAKVQDTTRYDGIMLRLIGSGSNFYARADLRRTGISAKTLTTNGIKTVGVNTPICIRFKKVNDTMNIWLVDGSESNPFGAPDNSLTNSLLIGDFNVSQQACIGGTGTTCSGNNLLTTNNRFDGKLHSLRIYCNGTLDESSATQIFSSRPIPLIMKLAGSIWKIESNLDQKKIYVKGFGKVITDTLVTASEILTSGTATGEFYQYSGVRSTTSFTNATPIEMIRAVFAKLNEKLASNNNYKLSLLDFTGVSNTINSYNAQGNLLEIINQLMMIVNKSFYVSPRGRCIIENKNIDLTSRIKLKNGLYQITLDGFDDSTTTNDLYIYSRASGSFAFVHSSDSTSINDIGIYSKRILAPQLTDGTSVNSFASNFITESKNINRRYTIEAPFFLDFLRENFQVKVINSIKSLDANSTIKSITWKYPEAKTIIETGDYLLDGFDLERVSADTINGIFTDTEINPA